MNALNYQKSSIEHVEKKDDPFKPIEPLFNDLCKIVVKLPQFKFLESAEIQISLLGMLKKNLEKLSQSQSLYFEFVKGKFDDLVFNENPIITEEIEIVISCFSKDFVEILFFKCKYKKTLEFWFQNSNLKILKNAVCLAVCLGCNLPVLQFLKEKQFFQNIGSEDRKILLKRGKRFKNEGLLFLTKEFELDL